MSRRPRPDRPLTRARRRLAMTLAGALLGALVLVPSLHAAESHLDASCESGLLADETSGTGPVSYLGDVFAMADAPARRLQMLAAVEADRQGPAHRYCDTLVRFDNAVTVGAGTTGLGPGDPVSLAVTVDLHGEVSAGYAGPSDPADQRSFIASSLLYASVLLVDPDREVCVPDDGVETCLPTRLASFFAEARRELSGSFGWLGDPDGSLTESYRWSWALTGNRGTRLGDEDQLSSVHCAAWPTQLPCGATTPPPPPPADFEGTRTVLVDTFVGARLELSAVLSVLPQASTGAKAHADFAFGRGLDVEIDPGAGFEGLELTYDLGGDGPLVTISDVEVDEGDEGRAAAAFAVTLSRAVAVPVTVHFATDHGTATGDDYAAAAGTLTFAPGETEQTVTVDVLGDTLPEPDETFFVGLTDPQGSHVADGRGQGTIRNDDGASPTLSVADVAVAEGTGGQTAVELAAVLSAPAGTDVVFDYATADGTATQPADYAAAQGSVTIPAGETRATFTLAVEGDSAIEPDETFAVELLRPRGAQPARLSAAVTITDDDNVCVARLSFDFVEARGCFTREGGAWRSTGDVRINGLDLHPDGEGMSLLIDPAERLIRGFDDDARFEIRAGDFLAGTRAIHWQLPPLGAKERVRVTGLSVWPTDHYTLKGLKVATAMTLEFTRAREAMLTVPVGIPLLKEIKVGDMRFAGEAVLVADDDRGVHSDALRVTARELPVPPVTVKELSLAWDELRDRWEGSATVVVPTPENLSVSAGFAFEQGHFAGASGAVDNLNAPIGGGLYVQAIRFSVSFDPLELGGGIGISAGPVVAGKTAIRVDGDFALRFGDPFALSVSGRLKLVDFQLASAYFRYFSTGTVEFGGSIVLGLPDVEHPAGQPVYLAGALDGWVDGTRGFSAHAVALLRVFGFDVAGAEVLVSSVGLAACGRVTWLEVGFGYRWDTKELELMGPWACSVGAYEPAARAAVRTLAAESAEPVRLTLPRNDGGIVLKLHGDTGAPRVELVGPNGLSVATPAEPGAPLANGDFVVMRDEQGKTTIVAIRRPQGTWTLRQLPGSSVAITGIEQAKVLPEPSVAARVREANGGLELSWKLDPAPGQVVTFVEEGDGVAHVLARTSEARGTRAFEASEGETTDRQLVAVVEQNGIPRGRVVVARFTAPQTEPSGPAARSIRELRREVVRARLPYAIRHDLLASLRQAHRALAKRPPEVATACAALAEFRAALASYAGDSRIPAELAVAWIAKAEAAGC